MAANERTPGRPLDEYERRQFDSIAQNYGEPFPGAGSGARIGAPTPLPEQGPPRRETRQRHHNAVGLCVAGALAVGGAVLVGAYYASEDPRPTVAQVRAEAFRNPEVLRATGTCAKELAIENLRVTYGAAYDSEADIQHYPTFGEYINAQAIALTDDIACTPPVGTSGTSIIKVYGMDVVITGNTVIGAGPEVVSLIDYGSDVTDICNGATPDISGAEGSIAEQASQFITVAADYCPPTGK